MEKLSRMILHQELQQTLTYASRESNKPSRERFEFILEAMEERRVGKLLHGGDWVGDGRRRRSGPVSSDFLSLGGGN